MRRRSSYVENIGFMTKKAPFPGIVIIAYSKSKVKYFSYLSVARSVCYSCIFDQICLVVARGLYLCHSFSSYSCVPIRFGYSHTFIRGLVSCSFHQKTPPERSPLIGPENHT